MIAFLLARGRSFRRADDGVAAIEMAFVFPVALMLMSLIVASGQSLNAWRRTNAVAHTVTDLVSRTPDTTSDPTYPTAEDLPQNCQSTPSQTCGTNNPPPSLLGDLALSQLVMWPSDSTTLQITMTEILVNSSTNTGTVVWSQGYNGASPAPCGTKFTLNSNLVGAGATYMLVGAVSYSFQPLGVSMNLPVITLSASEYLTIRYAPQIIITNVTNTTSFNQCS
jgi:Flp pilus assembly protein TadG